MWSYSSCQVQGRGHIRTQVPCQDKTKTLFANGTHVIALADGAGSAKLSHFGAVCVVESITQLLAARFDELYASEDGRQVKVVMLEKVLADINAMAGELNCTPRDLAATMLVAAVKDDRFIIAHVGDGVIGYLDGAVLKVASAPANGEHANETFFVTSGDAVNTMRLFKGAVKDIAGFVLMSDGTEQSLYNKRSNTLSPAVIKLMQRNLVLDEDAMRGQLEATLKNVITTRTQDDCSLALLCRENSVLRPRMDFDTDEKCDLYGVRSSDGCAGRRVERYDLILELLQEPATCKAISGRIRLKPKYTRRQLEHLRAVGLVKYTNGVYHLGSPPDKA